ncbi:MAG: T9SS type A sorting domain-containing protein [Candidatus Eisenbacteria bacterium]
MPALTSLGRIVTLCIAAGGILVGSLHTAIAADPPPTWNPWDKESPEPYGYDVYTAADLPLGIVDPTDPPATLDLDRIPAERATLTVTPGLDRTSYSWFGSARITAEVRDGIDLATDCDSVVVVSAANPRVRARLVDDGTGNDAVPGDGIYSGVFDIGAGEGEARPTGTYTATVTAYRGADVGQSDTPSFSLYSVRRWTGITTSGLPDASDDYTAFFASPNGSGGFHHEIREFGLIRSTSVANAQIRIPVFPQANEITGLIVSGPGVANVQAEGNVIAFECDLTGSSVTRVTIEFDTPSDLAATHVDRYQTGDIGLRNFRNGYLVWNRYIHTAILGSSFTTPHGPGCIVDLHVTDLVTGDPHTVDCMERVAVHLDDTPVNDGTGTYPSNIKWQDDSLAWPVSGDLDSMVFHFRSGGNYGLDEKVHVERDVEFYADRHYFRHRYVVQNIDTQSHDFDFVWGREQWLYGASDRQIGDRGILPDDPIDYGGELSFPPAGIAGSWFAAFDNASYYAIGVIAPDETAVAMPDYVHLLCQPALGNSTGEYPIFPSGSCGNMENLFFEKTLGVLAPGESAEYEFYQWGGYAASRSALALLLDDDATTIAPDPAGIPSPGDGESPSALTDATIARVTPNPFHTETEVHLDLATPGAISLMVFDVQGRLVRTLLRGPLDLGPHVVTWDGAGLGEAPVPAGIYFLRMDSPSGSAVRKVTLER